MARSTGTWRTRMWHCCRRTRPGVLVLLGVVTGLLLFAAFFGKVIYYNHITQRARSLLSLQDVVHKGYSEWTNTNKDVTFNVFTVVNADAVVRSGDTIQVAQLEGVTFHLAESKQLLYYGPDNKLLHYVPSARVKLVNDTGVDNLAQNVLTVNIGVQSMLSKIGTLTGTLPPVVEETILSTLTTLLGEENLLFTTKSAEEVIFGYDDEVIARALDIATRKLCSLVKLNISSFDAACSNSLEDLLEYYGISSKVAGLVDMVLDYDMVSRVSPAEWEFQLAPPVILDGLPLHRSSLKTGKDDINHAHELETWQGDSVVTCCALSKCPPTLRIQPWKEPVPVSGTLGDRFNPNSIRKSAARVLSSPLKRTLNLELVKHTKTKLRHWSSTSSSLLRIAAEELENSTLSSSQLLYNMNGPRGVFNLSTCSNGVQTYLTKPLFLDVDGPIMDGSGDPVQNRAVLTTRTGEEKLPWALDVSSRGMYDSTYLVDADYGITLASTLRLQANVFVEPTRAGNVTVFENVQAALVPTGWYEERFVAQSETKEELASINAHKRAQAVLFYSLVGAATLLGLILVGLTVSRLVNKCSDSEAERVESSDKQNRNWFDIYCWILWKYGWVILVLCTVVASFGILKTLSTVKLTELDVFPRSSKNFIYDDNFQNPPLVANDVDYVVLISNTDVPPAAVPLDLVASISEILQAKALELNTTYEGSIPVLRSWYTFTSQNLTDIAPAYISSYSSVKGHSAAYQMKTNGALLPSKVLIDTFTELTEELNANLTSAGLNATTALTGFSMVLSSEAHGVTLLDFAPMPVALILLAVAFRGVGQVIAVLLNTFMCCGTSLLLLFGIAELQEDPLSGRVEQLSEPISTLVPPMAIVSAIAVSLNHGLFLLSQFSEERRGGLSVIKASEEMLRHSGFAIILSGAVLSLCFLAMTFLPSPIVFGVGIGGLISTLSCILVSLTFVPSLLLNFPPLSLIWRGLTFLCSQELQWMFWRRIGPSGRTLGRRVYRLMSRVLCCCGQDRRLSRVKSLRTDIGLFSLIGWLCRRYWNAFMQYLTEDRAPDDVALQAPLIVDSAGNSGDDKLRETFGGPAPEGGRSGNTCREGTEAPQASEFEDNEAFYDAIADESFYHALLHPSTSSDSHGSADPRRGASGTSGTSGDALFATVFSARNLDGHGSNQSNQPPVDWRVSIPQRAQTISSPEAPTLAQGSPPKRSLEPNADSKDASEPGFHFRRSSADRGTAKQSARGSVPIAYTLSGPLQPTARRVQKPMPEFAGSRFDPRALGVLNVRGLLSSGVAGYGHDSEVGRSSESNIRGRGSDRDTQVRLRGSASLAPSLEYRHGPKNRRVPLRTATLTTAVTPHALLHAQHSQAEEHSATILSASLSPNARMILEAAAVPSVETMAEKAHSSLTVFTAMAMEQKRRLLRSWWYRFSLLIFRLRYLVAIVFIGAFIPVLVALLGHRNLTASVRPLIPSHVAAADAYFKLYDDFGPSKGLEYTLVVGTRAPEGGPVETCLTDKFWRTTHKSFAKFAYFTEPELSLSDVGGPLYLDGIAVPFPLIKWARGDLLSPIEHVADNVIESYRPRGQSQVNELVASALDYLADIGSIPGGGEKLRYFLQYEVDTGLRHAEAVLDNIVGKGIAIGSSWLGQLLNITLLEDLGPLNLELQYLLNIGLSHRPPHQYTSLTISLSIDPLSIQGAEWLYQTRTYMDILEERTGYIWAITQGGVDYIDSKDASIHFFQIEMIVLASVALVGLIVVLRSAVAPVRVVVTLVLAIASMYAILILVYDVGALQSIGWEALRKDDGICWLTPILSFPVVVGLGLDYDMFLLSRILAFREMGFSDKASVILGLYKTGQTVLLGGLIVAVTFGGLMLSSLGILRQTAFAIVVGVLLHTVFILVLSPSFMAIMDVANFAPRELPLPILELPEHADEQNSSVEAEDGDVVPTDHGAQDNT